jgi:hypothetical protein
MVYLTLKCVWSMAARRLNVGLAVRVVSATAARWLAARILRDRRCALAREAKAPLRHFAGPDHQLSRPRYCWCAALRISARYLRDAKPAQLGTPLAGSNPGQ